MFISKTEFEDDPGLITKVRQWIGSLNIAAKKAETHQFKLKGDSSICARPRAVGAFRGPRPSVPYTFNAGEEFQLASVSMDKDIAADGVRMNMIFAPVGLARVNEITSLTLPMAEAFELFEGLEEWVDVSVVETTAAQREKAAEVAAVAHLPTVEETRASESWGAW